MGDHVNTRASFEAAETVEECHGILDGLGLEGGPLESRLNELIRNLMEARKENSEWHSVGRALAEWHSVGRALAETDPMMREDCGVTAATARMHAQGLRNACATLRERLDAAKGAGAAIGPDMANQIQHVLDNAGVPAKGTTLDRVLWLRAELLATKAGQDAMLARLQDRQKVLEEERGVQQRAMQREAELHRRMNGAMESLRKALGPAGVGCINFEDHVERACEAIGRSPTCSDGCDFDCSSCIHEDASPSDHPCAICTSNGGAEDMFERASAAVHGVDDDVLDAVLVALHSEVGRLANGGADMRESGSRTVLNLARSVEALQRSLR